MKNVTKSSLNEINLERISHNTESYLKCCLSNKITLNFLKLLGFQKYIQYMVNCKSAIGHSIIRIEKFWKYKVMD